MGLEELVQSLEGQYPVKLDVYSKRVNDGVYAGGMVISRIEVPKEQQRQGIGGKVMNELMRYADKNNLVVGLTPEQITNTSKSALIDFYKTFGFVPNKGKHKHWDFMEAMIR